MNTSLVTALTSLLSIAAICYLIFWFWPSYRVDRYREDLFALRDRLFDLAAAGRIGFDHPAYISTCAFLNGSIATADRVHWLVVLQFFLRTPRPGAVVPAHVPLHAGLGDVGRDIEAIERETHTLMWLQMFFASPVFVLSLAPTILFVLVRLSVPLVGPWLLRQSQRLSYLLQPFDAAARTQSVA